MCVCVCACACACGHISRRFREVRMRSNTNPRKYTHTHTHTHTPMHTNTPEDQASADVFEQMLQRPLTTEFPTRACNAGVCVCLCKRVDHTCMHVWRYVCAHVRMRMCTMYVCVCARTCVRMRMHGAHACAHERMCKLAHACAQRHAHAHAHTNNTHPTSLPSWLLAEALRDEAADERLELCALCSFFRSFLLFFPFLFFFFSLRCFCGCVWGADVWCAWCACVCVWSLASRFPHTCAPDPYLALLGLFCRFLARARVPVPMLRQSTRSRVLSPCTARRHAAAPRAHTARRAAPCGDGGVGGHSPACAPCLGARPPPRCWRCRRPASPSSG